MGARRPLERVLIVPAIDRQVERHHSRTARCPGGTEVGNSHSACVSFANEPPERGAIRQMSPANTNSGRVSDSQPREVMNVAVLAESELGSEAQRERRKRILDATMAIASKGGYEAVQMRAVADRADVAVGTLYRYFPSKVHLLVSALGREFEPHRRQNRPLRGGRRHAVSAAELHGRQAQPRDAAQSAAHRGDDTRLRFRRRVGGQRGRPGREADRQHVRARDEPTANRPRTSTTSPG